MTQVDIFPLHLNLLSRLKEATMVYYSTIAIFPAMGNQPSSPSSNSKLAKFRRLRKLSLQRRNRRRSGGQHNNPGGIEQEETDFGGSAAVASNGQRQRGARIEEKMLTKEQIADILVRARDYWLQRS